MNREIKFRGKRVDTKEWVYGYYWRNCETGKFCITVSEMGDDSYHNFEVIPETLGQFTNGTDESNKEMYEGDLIHYMAEDAEVYEAVIKFDDGSACEGTPFVSGFIAEIRKCVSEEYENEIESNEPIEVKVIGDIYTEGNNGH